MTKAFNQKSRFVGNVNQITTSPIIPLLAKSKIPISGERETGRGCFKERK
jgi:hypothetical protein